MSEEINNYIRCPECNSFKVNQRPKRLISQFIRQNDNIKSDIITIIILSIIVIIYTGLMVRYHIIVIDGPRAFVSFYMLGVLLVAFTWHRISEVSGYWGKSEKIHSCKSCGFHFKSDFYNPDNESDSESLR